MKNKHSMLTLLIFIIFSFIIFIQFSISINAYDIKDFFKDLEVLNDSRMNIAQINAARMRIKLFLNRTSFEDLFYQIYILSLELNDEELNALLNKLKSILSESQYKKLIKILKKNKENGNSSKSQTSTKKDNSSSINESTSNNVDNNETNNTINNNTSSTNTSDNNDYSNAYETTNNDKKTGDKEENTNNETNIDDKNQNDYSSFASTTTNDSEIKDNNNVEQKSKENSDSEKNSKSTYSEKELKEIFKKGYEQFYKKDYKKSLENFLIAYNNNYNIVSSSYYLGLLYEKKNDFKKAAFYFEKTYSLTIKLYSLNFNFLSFILKKTGINYYKLNNYQKALNYFLKSLEYNPSDGDIYYWLGLVYYNIKNNNKALAYWKKGSLLGNSLCLKSYNWLKNKQ